MLRKRCGNCSEKISKSHKFCEHCGASQQNPEEWGMLGQEDTQDNFQNMLGGLGSGIFNKMLGSAMKMLEKEMQKEMSRENQQPPKVNSNIRLMINGKEINFKEKSSEKQNEKKLERISNRFSSKNLERFSKLPKKEPKTNILRLSDKVIYEIDVPKVKSLEDVSIVNLENSIEVKAVTKNEAYQKIIPVGLAVKNYQLQKGKLILELDSEN